MRLNEKTLLTVLACSAILLSLVACNKNEPEPEHVAQVVDLRNKDTSGKNIRSARGADSKFSYKLMEEVHWNGFEEGTVKGQSYCYTRQTGMDEKDYGPETAEYKKMANAIKFEDCEDGVKFVFTKPEGYDNVSWIVLQYIDCNGQRSTCIDNEDFPSIFNGNNGNFEIVYPLVKSGQQADFWLQLGNGNEDQLTVNFRYRVMPVHELGVVDDLQVDYDETDYISIAEDGHTLNLKMVIPPDAENLTHWIEFDEQTGKGRAWGYENVDGKIQFYTVNGLGSSYDNASQKELDAAAAGKEVVDFSIDLNDYLDKGFDLTKSKNYDYFFVGFAYRYTMKDPKYAGYMFSSPQIKSLPVKNIFKK